MNSTMAPPQSAQSSRADVAVICRWCMGVRDGTEAGCWTGMEQFCGGTGRHGSRLPVWAQCQRTAVKYADLLPDGKWKIILLFNICSGGAARH